MRVTSTSNRSSIRRFLLEFLIIIAKTPRRRVRVRSAPPDKGREPWPHKRGERMRARFISSLRFADDGRRFGARRSFGSLTRTG